ncbi:MAG: methyltransferase [Bacteroidetes bacterium]|nr:methyltransferase [Bacteroidota bacterium]
MAAKKTPAFQFKKFTIQQQVNAQKVGTDSMLLGAWSKGNFTSILDIGTGTGILALMLAQQNPSAQIIAIEPDADSLTEANQNFEASVFKSRINGIQTTLQHFTSAQKFDLIISNPPYFENSTLSENMDKNRVRHTNELPIADLYQKAAEFLSPQGNLNLIFPFEVEQLHLDEAKKQKLFPQKILRTVREEGVFKRTLVSYAFNAVPESEEQLLVKFSDNTYSPEYIALTKDFYATDLTAKGL